MGNYWTNWSEMTINFRFSFFFASSDSIEKLKTRNVSRITYVARNFACAKLLCRCVGPSPAHTNTPSHNVKTIDSIWLNVKQLHLLIRSMMGAKTKVQTKASSERLLSLSLFPCSSLPHLRAFLKRHRQLEWMNEQTNEQQKKQQRRWSEREKMAANGKCYYSFSFD